MSQSASVLRSARREAVFVAILWLLGCVYVVGYAGLFAYRQETPPRLLWGMPEWVVRGILLPWLVVTGLTVWYALRGMKDEDLGEEHPMPDSHDAPGVEDGHG